MYRTRCMEDEIVSHTVSHFALYICVDFVDCNLACPSHAFGFGDGVCIVNSEGPSGPPHARNDRDGKPVRLRTDVSGNGSGKDETKREKMPSVTARRGEMTTMSFECPR
ncbi:hypothetical protein EDB85DRAFT_1897997 [Lactarius pseudohatsudake]|nr:hypothetical protein EDB85DRAFT_1897997 [Lactarius pseudohatsudake]